MVQLLVALQTCCSNAVQIQQRTISVTLTYFCRNHALTSQHTSTPTETAMKSIAGNLLGTATTFVLALFLFAGYSSGASAQILPPPANLSPADGSQIAATATVIVSWNPVPNATSYNVRANNWSNGALRAPGNNCPGDPHYMCIDNLTASSISLPVDAGSSYGFWLHACNANGCSDAATSNFSVLAAPPPPPTEACIPSGNDTNISNALVGASAKAVLCQFSTFSLSSTISFNAPSQEIHTAGFPINDAAKALLRIDNPALQTAVAGANQSGVKLRNIKIDGGRPSSTATTGNALISLGGDATGQVVEQVRAWEPKGWTVLHVFEGGAKSCSNASISSNAFGPAGWPGRYGPNLDPGWADGISLACKNSTVSNNTITDATDGGIVVFGAPGSLISSNTIEASSRKLLGGINLVDYAPFDGNYAGTVVNGNWINASGAQIIVGIAMGPRTWSADWVALSNSGGTVTNNTLLGPYMGYGFVAGGVQNWIVTGNTSSAIHSGVPSNTLLAYPSVFQKNCESTTGTFQAGFSTGNLTGVLGLGGPSGNVAPDYPPRDLSPACQNLPQTSTVTLTWKPSPGATQYFVRVTNTSAPALRLTTGNNCPGDPHYLCQDGVTGTSITMPVTPGHVYAWWIHAGTSTAIGSPASANFSVRATP